MGVKGGEAEGRQGGRQEGEGEHRDLVVSKVVAHTLAVLILVSRGLQMRCTRDSERDKTEAL